MPSLREQAALTEQRVLDHFESTGALPAEFVRFVQASAWKRGAVLTEEQVRQSLEKWADEGLVRRWSEELLAADDARKG